VKIDLMLGNAVDFANSHEILYEKKKINNNNNDNNIKNPQSCSAPSCKIGLHPFFFMKWLN